MVNPCRARQSLGRFYIVGVLAGVGAAVVAFACGTSKSPSPVGSSCSQDGDCMTGYCGKSLDGKKPACACAPEAHVCNVDADCCPGAECRGFTCVAGQTSCTPSGVVLADGGTCCSGNISFEDVCCDAPGATCTSDGQCCNRSCVVSRISGVSGGSGFCCAPVGTRCSAFTAACCDTCGQNGTCCTLSAGACNQDGDCCSGKCQAGGICH
jgi:hypothetical protein